MASKKPVPAKTSAPAAPAAPKAPRKPKSPSMPFAQRFELQAFVKDADPTLPDASLASQATFKFGRTIQKSAVTSYRKAFGLASVGKPKTEALLRYIGALKNAIRALGYEPFEMGSASSVLVAIGGEPAAAPVDPVPAE